jgi:hypothetical protein
VIKAILEGRELRIISLQGNGNGVSRPRTI